MERIGRLFYERNGVLMLGMGLLIAWVIAWSMMPNQLAVLESHGHFFGLGLIGAIVANSTGAGGGVVFIPAFTALGISPKEALGTSICIQCFGMTAGSLSWIAAFHRQRDLWPNCLHLVRRLLLISAPASILGMWIGQYWLPVEPGAITPIFRGFSVVFGIVLLYVTFFVHKEQRGHDRVRPMDSWIIVPASLVGGLVTSWISVGSGELLALLLIFRGYPTMASIAAAVCVSSATVIAGVWAHGIGSQSVVWEVVLFAAPAAICGGVVARLLAARLGAVRLKVFFATWILATGLIGG